MSDYSTLIEIYETLFYRATKTTHSWILKRKNNSWLIIYNIQAVTYW